MVKEEVVWKTGTLTFAGGAALKSLGPLLVVSNTGSHIGAAVQGGEAADTDRLELGHSARAGGPVG